jgi:hypothetical protein
MIILRIIVSKIERMIDVARGKMQVTLSRTMRISPGKRPIEMPVFDAKYTIPPININIRPMMTNQRARDAILRTILPMNCYK